MSTNSFHGTEQLEISDIKILPNHSLPNARRDGPMKVTSRTVMALMILTTMVTLALIGFMRAKMEEMENLSTELLNIQNSLATNVSAIVTKVEKSEKQIEKLFRIDQPQNNNWNPADCHSDLLINEKRKSVQRKANDDYYWSEWRSCRAKIMVPRHFGLFYYEVEIMHKSGAIGIGIMPKEVPLLYVGAYTYRSDGYLLMSYSDEHAMPEFGVGDTVGVGVNLDTRQIICTKNGKRLDTTNLHVRTVDLFPAVSLNESLDAVEANFGPHFRYNLAEEFGVGIVP